MKIFRDLLKPIVTLEVLQQQPHPIDTLYKQCAKQGREVTIKPWRDGAKNIASVYVDGVFVASGSSDQLMDIARLNAAKQALLELAKSMPTNIGRLDFSFGLNKSLEIEGAMQKLNEFCQKKRWALPSYRYELLYHKSVKNYIYIIHILTQHTTQRNHDFKSRFLCSLSMCNKQHPFSNSHFLIYLLN